MHYVCRLHTANTVSSPRCSANIEAPQRKSPLSNHRPFTHLGPFPLRMHIVLANTAGKGSCLLRQRTLHPPVEQDASICMHRGT